MSAYDPEILGMFLAESRERLMAFQSGMLTLESNPEDVETLNALFREMHTIKGGARFLECAPVSELCHVSEDFLDDLRHGKWRLTKDVASILLAAADRIGEAFAIMERQEIIPPDFTLDLISRLAVARQIKGVADVKEPGDDVQTAFAQIVHDNSHMIRSVLGGLSDPYMDEAARESIVAAIEELKTACEYAGNEEALARAQSLGLAISAIRSGAETAVEKAHLLSELDRLGRAVKPKEIVAPLPPPGPAVDNRNQSDRSSTGDGSNNRSDNLGLNGTTLRVEQSKIDRGIALAGELSIMRLSLRHAARQIAREPSNLTSLFEAADVLDRIANEIEEHAQGLRRVAMRHCFGRFPRVIRDLSLTLNKEIDLIVEGDGIEVDKTVVEALAEPLVHVLRNACDHGLENGDERERQGKPRRGRIRVSAAYEGKQVVIEIADDGRGISLDQVAAKGIALGLITAEAVALMTVEERAQLIFLPGLTTAERITDVSGRGVGMDVVKRTVDSLGGQITISTGAATGTTFRIQLPPASFVRSFTSSVLVRVGEALYGLPIDSVHETIKVPLDDIQCLGSHPAICLRGDLVPIRTLASLLGRSDGQSTAGREGLRDIVREGQVAIAILTTPQGLLGLAVDQLIGQQGLVVKPLPSLLGTLPGISGASIHADGRILLIIDAGSIIAAASGTIGS
jgi:two-component system chemotaxis sensor kinase CheA